MSLDRGWQTVVCCASGPSFSERQAEIIAEARSADRCRVVVVNDNYRRVQNADVLYAGDGAWWKFYIERVRALFAGELWTQDHAASIKYGLCYVKLVRVNTLLPVADDSIAWGLNSGFQAIMLARLFGARRIVLVGFDMQRAGGTDRGALHWFGNHPSTLSNGSVAHFVKHFNAVAPALRDEGTDVINCSAETALACFPRADLTATLA